MPIAYFYSNTAQPTTLAGSISSGATTVTVVAVTGWPVSYPYVVALDYGTATEELALVTSASSTALTVTRAFGGTTAQSHSVGAVVKHVYNAVDATDFRAHEAATSAVHGVTGTLVGTSDTQTLTNKTISGAALSGTLSGSPSLPGNPIFSGNPSFSGTPSFSGVIDAGGGVFAEGTVRANESATTAVGLATSVTTDSSDRFQVLGDGTHQWGTGSAALDTVLKRESAGQLSTTDSGIRAYRASTGSTALSTRVAGDTVSRLDIAANGTLAWSSGSSASDASLAYSVGGVTLTGQLNLAGQLVAGAGANFTSGTWQLYTPTWSASTTAPSLGNGSLNGRYCQWGHLYVVAISFTPGTTTNYGSGFYTFGLPVAAASNSVNYVGHAEFLGTARWAGQVVVTPGAQGSAAFFPTASNDCRLTSMTPNAPETFGTSSSLRITVVYEGLA